MINQKDFIVIQGWMVSDLNLKGLELYVYAIIYGFTRGKQGKFTGNLQYLCDWTSSTKQGTLKALNSLVDKGFIEKNEVYYNNVKFVEYHSTEFNGGIKLSLPNNIDNNIKEKVLFHNTKENFVPPSVEEVNNYVNNMNYHFNPEEFVAHYESVGWMIGNKPVKSWEACCRTWEINWKKNHPNYQPEFKYNEREL